MNKPKMLLHSCCGPCSTSVIQRLVQDYEITVYYFNPNIYPNDEFEKRQNEQERFIREYTTGVKFIKCNWQNESYENLIQGLEACPEGGDRCTKCFWLRLENTAQKCKELGYDIFATTLSVSPHKNAKLINEIGLNLKEKYGVDYLVSDFKKQDGYLNSIRLSKQYNLYRQNYCGCKYSMHD